MGQNLAKIVDAMARQRAIIGVLAVDAACSGIAATSLLYAAGLVLQGNAKLQLE
jgi:hypothetical protein